MHATPHPDLPSILYKYRALPMDDTPEGKNQRAKVERLIGNGELYFAKASQLNDPFEAAPRVRHTNRSKGADYFKLFTQRYCQGMSPAKRIEAMQTWRNRHDGKPFQLEDARILALSASPTVPLLWAHYASNHTGVAVGLRTDGFLNCVRPVTYSEAYPEYKMFDDREENLTNALYTKAKYWEYEQEWRFGMAGTEVAVTALLNRGLKLHLASDNTWTGAMDLGPGLVKEVVIGLKAPPKVLPWIRSLVRGKNIRVLKAIKDPDCYGVKLESLRL